jgi:hypothetical protein
MKEATTSKQWVFLPYNIIVTLRLWEVIMNWFQSLRFQRQVSQRSLAKKLQINPSVVPRLEGGWFARCPGKDLDARLQAFLGPKWTFEKLMDKIPDLAAPQQSAKSEKAEPSQSKAALLNKKQDPPAAGRMWLN